MYIQMKAKGCSIAPKVCPIAMWMWLCAWCLLLQYADVSDVADMSRCTMTIYHDPFNPLGKIARWASWCF